MTVSKTSETPDSVPFAIRCWSFYSLFVLSVEEAPANWDAGSVLERILEADRILLKNVSILWIFFISE